jgi:uncharacterized protein with HEPN domain
MIDRLPLYLQRMEATASEAVLFVKDMDEAAFRADIKTQKAVAMSLVILGEAVAGLAKDYPQLLADHSDIPWRDIQGLRNRLAHGYFDIDLGVVWDTATNSLPDFLDRLHLLQNWHAQGE